MCDCDPDRKNRNYYRYYDTPDGCDIPKKVMVTTRYGIIAGLIMSSYDVLMYSHAVGFGPILKRYMYHTIPLGLMGATFAIVANGLLHARDADDRLNYFAGGAACAPILAAYVGSGHGLVPGAIVLGIIAMVKKDAIDKNYTFFQNVPSHMNTVRHWRHDYTLIPDPRDELLHTCTPPK
ncbi:NADH dehydrogenase [ubiquinone] 1 alpha subcomplex subunit 11-like [Anticarsia gemmatalis]|uniref:NADH dehydrogenase [ubiquinone] 1 alpha subcomplex subunit 11-like n=1 Tax=Anticarsia gemmatalis TaxID=129554 RepID=UPI003F7735B7